MLNVNVAPPVEVVGTIELADDDDTAKSDARPVVAAEAAEAVIVHIMEAPARRGATNEQDKDEEAVGRPNTGNVMDPPAISDEDTASLTETK